MTGTTTGAQRRLGKIAKKGRLGGYHGSSKTYDGIG